jgi:hypothetical protein
MKMARTACAVFAFGWLLSVARAESRAADTPISKVLELLNSMAVKGQADKNAEEKRFTAFWQWCEDQTRIKNNEIASGKEQIEMLKAEIEKAAALIRSLSSRIGELEEDVGRWKKDQSSASDVRAKEATDYRATADDYTETLSALDDAIVTLKKQAFSRPQAELVQQSLVQVQKLPLVPLASKKALAAFLQQPSVEAMPDDQLFNKAPEAAAYEFQSGGVIDMLEKLKDQFGSKKYELDKEELKAQHAHEQIMQQLTDNIENAEHEIARKTTGRAETQQAKADSEGELAATIADLKEDSTYLDDMTAMCATKKADFERRDKMRADEIAAIKEAVEIISSKAVAGSGETHLPALMQIWKRRGASLVQFRSSNDQSPLQARIATFLADRAQKLDSRLLAMISQRVSADPFTKVKKLVKDLIWKLTEEATAETEHKGWCDTELSTNKQTRDAKSEEVGKLTAEAEQLTSEIAQLGQDIEDLTSAIAELSAAMGAATEDRTKSKATNEATIKDAKEAQVAVENAIAVLKDYYAKSAQATSLTQTVAKGEGRNRAASSGKRRQSPSDDAPETFDAPYKGQLPEGGSVADFLEVILTDFARLESETTTAEATEVEEHKKYMFASEKDKALKENEKGHKESKKSDKESSLHSTEEELKATQEQLDAAAAYYEKLKPTCVDSGITYEDRVKRREEEIQSLKEALQILSGTAIDLP